MTKLTNPLKSAICNRMERFSRMRRQNAPMCPTTTQVKLYYESHRTVESHKKFVYRPLPQTSTTAPT